MISTAALVLCLLVPHARGRIEEPVEVDLGPGVIGVAAVSLAEGEPRKLLVAREDGLSLVDWERGGAVVARLPRGDREAMGWCVADSRGGDEVLVAFDGGDVVSWRGGDPARVVRDRRLLIPSGVLSIPFGRDLDGDGLADLALPRANGFQLWMRREDGGARPGASVRHEVDIDVRLDGHDEDSPEFTRRVSIPAFTVRDQNEDGVPDLAFRDDDRAQFFWSRPDGTLPDEPTFELDLEEIRSSLPKKNSGILDPNNLLRALESQVSYLARDLDEDGYDDLLLRRGTRVLIYGGSAAGIDRSKPRQILRTSGNLLAAYALDDDGDGRKDLCLLLVSDISIAKVLVWLVAGADLTLELNVYRQQDRLRFARKPTRRRVLTVDVPSLGSLDEELEEPFERLSEGFERAPIDLDLDGDGARDDVAWLLEDGVAEVFLDAGVRRPDEPGSAWLDVIRRFDEAAGGGVEHRVGIAQIVDWIPIPGADLRDLIRGRPATRRVTLSSPDRASHGVMFGLDLSGDRRDDLVFANVQDDRLRLSIVVTR